MKIEKLLFKLLQSIKLSERSPWMHCYLVRINGVDVVEGLLGSNNKAKTGMMRFEGDEPAVKGLNDCIAALRRC